MIIHLEHCPTDQPAIREALRAAPPVPFPGDPWVAPTPGVIEVLSSPPPPDPWAYPDHGVTVLIVSAHGWFSARMVIRPDAASTPVHAWVRALGMDALLNSVSYSLANYFSTRPGGAHDTP